MWREIEEVGVRKAASERRVASGGGAKCNQVRRVVVEGDAVRSGGVGWGTAPPLWLSRRGSPPRPTYLLQLGQLAPQRLRLRVFEHFDRLATSSVVFDGGFDGELCGIELVDEGGVA